MITFSVGLFPGSENTMIGQILANIYYTVSNSKILDNSTERSLTLKVIVLCDYLELSESPQHGIHGNIHCESIWRTLVTPNPIQTVGYPWLPFGYLCLMKCTDILEIGSQLRRGAHMYTGTLGSAST